jgi:glycosyltransferase involved in cell wall biosynthesis
MLLISGLMYGGGQKVVLDLLGELRHGSGLDVQLTLLGCREPALRQAATHVVPYDGRYNQLTTLLLTAWRLRNQLKFGPPGVLHTHGWDADIIGWLAILGLKTRQIIHLHITPVWVKSTRLTHRVRRFLTRLAFARRGTVVIAVSNAVRDHWARLLPFDAGDIVTVHNGIDTAFYATPGSRNDQPNKDPIIGVVARLEPMKGIEYLLDAAANLVTDYPRIRLRIAGEGSLKDDLENRVNELGLAGNVEFLGRVRAMKSFYGCIDILVLPSISTEGLPLVVLEAMAATLPIVATTVGGTAEVIGDGRDGLLVPPRDPAALADAIRRLLSDKALRQRLGDSAKRRVVANFSIAKCANSVIDLYRAPAPRSVI